MPGVRTSRLDIERYCEDNDIELLLLDGFDEAFVGVVTRFGIDEPVAVYDRDKIIEILMREGSSWEQAEEHFAFNIIGAWVGDKTPFFLSSLEPKEDDETELGIIDLVKGTKWCPRCKKHRPLDDFNRNRARYDGRDSWCRDCRKLYRQEHEPAEGVLTLNDGEAQVADWTLLDMFPTKDK